MSASVARRAIGIVRVSRVNGREGESFASPNEQRQRIEQACERDGLRLLDVLDEMDVSGGTALEDRTGLRSAIEAIENGRADVVISAYFDRLCRSLKAQGELIDRVEAAGGKVMAVDVGQVTGASAGQWLTGTLHGAMNEYVRRVAKERSGEAQARAVARGALPFPAPPGYRRDKDGKAVPYLPEVPVVREAFRMRAAGKTVREVRGYLRAHGIERTYHGAQLLLASRVVLGEVHHGKLVNLNAHEPIVDRETWNAVQRMKVSRGRRAKSDHLLARLKVLRCGTCGSPLIIGSAGARGTERGRYYTYRCSPTSDCPNRMSVSAVIAEQVVTDAVRAALADQGGHASAETNVREAEQALTQAQSALEAAVRAFDGLGDELAARERLQELRETRDDAQAHLDQSGGGTRPILTLNAANNWGKLTLDERRALIRATVKQALVGPGRGSDRIAVELFV
jgi:site-specific DNA recombinase